MTTNFITGSLNPETNTSRISIGDGKSSYCDDKLIQQPHQINDRIDTCWTPSTISSVNDEITMVPSSSPYMSSLSVQDLVIQRQRQLLLKEEKIRLTPNQKQLFLLSRTGNNSRETHIDASSLTLTNNNCKAEDNAIPLCNCNDSLDHSISPTSVITLKQITEPIETKTQVAFGRQNRDSLSAAPTGEQCQHHQHRPRQQDHQHQQNQQQQPEVDFAYLYPREDQRSRVRFSSSLSVYDNFEDYDYSDEDHKNSLEIIEEKTARVNKESNDSAFFLLRRARRCWYSKEDLKVIKNERKEVVRALKKANFDINSIDTSVHELRGLEAYMSLEIIWTTQRKRREALESVLNEQRRQRQLLGGKRNAERLQFISLRASEWFRTRAFDIAKKDARKAHDLYLNHSEVMRMMGFYKDSGESITGKMESTHQQQGIAEQNVSMIHESLHESLGLVDVNDYGGRDSDSCGNGSALNFWASSSWTKGLMDE